MYVIICGGRGYALRASDCAWLESLGAESPFLEVVTGGAIGADAGAKHWAEYHGIDTVTFHPNWTKYGKSAGPRRNTKMLDYLIMNARVTSTPCAVIAFKGGPGTADMVRQAEKAGVPVMMPPQARAAAQPPGERSEDA